MFRDKYVYTCPDMIHARARAKTINRRIIGLNIAGVVLVMAVGYVVDKFVVPDLPEPDPSTDET